MNYQEQQAQLEKYSKRLDAYQHIYAFIYKKYVNIFPLPIKEVMAISVDLKDPILQLASRTNEEIQSVFQHSLLELIARDHGLILDGKKMKLLSEMLDEKDFKYIMDYNLDRNIKSRHIITPEITKEILILNLQYFYFSLANDYIKPLIFEKLNLNQIEANSSLIENFKTIPEIREVVYQELIKLLPQMKDISNIERPNHNE